MTTYNVKTHLYMHGKEIAIRCGDDIHISQELHDALKAGEKLTVLVIDVETEQETLSKPLPLTPLVDKPNISLELKYRYDV